MERTQLASSRMEENYLCMELNNHIKLLHETFPFPCEKCKHNFSAEGKLKSHLLWYHGKYKNRLLVPAKYDSPFNCCSISNSRNKFIQIQSS
jgi:hypothetical protein